MERGKIEKNLGYSFKNKELLDIALSMPSAKKKYRLAKQRQEFLGDSFIEFVLTSVLFSSMPVADEGILTRIRSYLVSKEAMDKIAQDIGVARHGRNKGNKFLCDTLEAIVGGVLLDGGAEVATDVVLRLWMPLIDRMSPGDLFGEKELLQRIIQSHSNGLPDYEIVAEKDGFLCRVFFEGKELGIGRGKNKRQAQLNAAKNALENGFDGLF